MVSPPAVAAGLGVGIGQLLALETLILCPARAGAFDFAAFDTALAAIENART